MSVGGLETCLFDLANSARARRTYGEAPESFLERYALHDDERALLRGCDVAEMFRRGVNPMLLAGFYMGIHGPTSMPDYIAKMPTLASVIDGGK